MTTQETPDPKYASHYSDASFWRKVRGVLKTAGREVLEKALWLYFAMQRPETPMWAKATIAAALGYFILPFDLVPDVVPLLGYTDDASVLAGALVTVAAYVDGGVKEAAATKLRDWGMNERLRSKR